MSRAMKDSGIAWIGEIPEGWTIKRNKALFYEVNDRCENGSDYTLLSVSEYTGVLPRSQIVGEGEYETHAESLDGYKICAPGDIVMNIMLAWKRATARTAFEGIVSPAYSVFRGKGIDTRYYHFLFRTELCADYFKRFSTGIIDSRLRLYPNVFLSLTMPVPPIHEQSRIAAYLDRRCAEIDSVIAATQRTIEEYKKLKQSIITEAVTHGVRGQRKMKDSGVDWIGEIPEEWSVYRIANVYDERNESGSDDLPILLVSINTGISDHEVSDDEQTRVFVRIEDRTKYKRVYPGDLAYNMMRAWQGAFGAARVDGMVSPAYVVAKPKGNALIESRYIEALLRSPSAIDEMHRYSKGITDFRLRLYWPEFKNIRVCIPTYDEQVEIADYIDQKSSDVDILIETKQQLLTQLESYKKSVIYEYVTGKREVPECQ